MQDLGFLDLGKRYNQGSEISILYTSSTYLGGPCKSGALKGKSFHSLKAIGAVGFGVQCILGTVKAEPITFFSLP